MAQTIQQKVETLAQLALKNSWMLVTAESCTGGGIATALTELAGSSAWFAGGFVTYSNEMKQKLLAVDAHVIQQKGAVSKEVVEMMTSGALEKSGADLAVAVSGVAGPDGGTVDKPVGTVWIGWQIKSQSPLAKKFNFGGDRHAVRSQTIEASIQGLIDLIK